MEKQRAISASEILPLLPSVDVLIRSKAAVEISNETSAKHLTVLARVVVDKLRGEILEIVAGDKITQKDFTRETLLAEAEKNLIKLFRNEQNKGLRRVINATGVVIHTNLGRAPLSENARRAIAETASGYCNLEYDIETGRRGKRGERAEQLLAEITGAESALVVNNCAAACILVFTALAKGGEAIVSRGELVEIGGDFRIPDVMIESGATLKEVGATNRTRVGDYERAISENTRLIVKVHPSNYRIIGFTATPNVSELAQIARENDVLLYEDAGSGALIDLSRYGLTDEPVISKSIADGADVVTFSGDKLLGGAQSGCIVGRRDTIEKLRRHPLYRALRVDKLIYAALEATLESFARDAAVREIPVLKMLAQTADEIKKRAENFVAKLNEACGEDSGLLVEITPGNSVVGGGSAPAVQPPTTLLAVTHEKMSSAALEESLRFARPPIIARIVGDRVLIDLRTVFESQEIELLEILRKI